MSKGRVLITGGARGIGKATVDLLKSEEYDVVYPTHEELDLNDNHSVECFCMKHRDDYFSVLINNAGINDINSIECVTDDEIHRTMNINLISPIKLSRAFVPQMIKHNYGRIVNIGSIWGVVSKTGRVVYSTTKHGIHGLTKTLAVELAENNILVNTVNPGFTLTELTKKNNTSEQIKKIENEIPIKRLAQPIEIANIISWLVSEKNTYLTGQMITIDGGFTSR